MRYSIILFTFFLLSACNNGNVASGALTNLEGFQITDLGSGGQKADKKDGAGVYIENGYLLNGVKNGIWRTYNDDGKVKTITNYLNGLKNGPYYEFSNRGQIELAADYLNDKLDGLYAKYKFGRPTIETQYRNGLIHGVHKEYFQNKDNLQKEVHFKDGKQDGKLTYYDEEGNVTLEYEYKNGEKVGGGMIEKK